MRHDREWNGLKIPNAPKSRSWWRMLFRLGAGERRPEPMDPQDYPREWRRDAVARPVGRRGASG